MDIKSKEERSRNMSRIRSKDTTPEKMVRSFLHKNGFRFRLHVKELPGKPDIVLPKYKTVIEVRGCYWHRHNCKKGQSCPSSNVEFWQRKFESNVIRDQYTEYRLKKLGWNVIIVWECEVDTKVLQENILEKIISKAINV